jgi:hypothetical protein
MRRLLLGVLLSAPPMMVPTLVKGKNQSSNASKMSKKCADVTKKATRIARR